MDTNDLSHGGLAAPTLLDHPKSASFIWDAVRPVPPIPEVSPASRARKTLIFANDKSSGKTTSANAVIVGLLHDHPALMRSIEVREYERHARLAAIFHDEGGIGSLTHRDARNAAAFEATRELAHDPNATVWDDMIYAIGVGDLIIDLGSNMFTEICRILDDEPHPIFPDDGDRVGVVVPVTTAGDSLESGVSAIEGVLSWGARTRVFIIEQEYFGRFDDAEMREWTAYRDRLVAAEPNRVRVTRVERLAVANIGSVVFQRIDRMMSEAQKMLSSDDLTGAALVRALRKARGEIAWGNRTLLEMSPIVEWFGS